MPTNEKLPEWCGACPNRGYCPIQHATRAWVCEGRRVLAEQTNKAIPQIKEDDDG